MITFRTEQTVGDVVTMTEVDVVYNDDDSDSAIAANNKMVNVFCELLLPSDQVASIEQAQSNLYQSLPSSLINRPTPPGAE
tara:strand:- start:26 stop:268 length:243 start_codon:yes stop_codon:yes gene_type:complete